MTNLPFTGNFKVTKFYGERGNYSAGYHTGIDIVGISSTNIYSVCNGTIKTLYKEVDKNYGKYVKITDSDTGKVFLFAHLASINDKLAVGDAVTRATVIGVMGNTGNSYGAHTHIKMRTANDRYGEQEDPASYMKLVNITKGTIYNSNNFQIENIPNMMYAAHCQNLGWQEEKRNRQMAGLYGQGLRIEAIIINADINIQYRVHMAGIGWRAWVPNGCMAGTIGESRAIEAIEIQSSKNTMVGQGYVENIGYQGEVKGTQIMIGTTGQGLRLERFRLKFI